MTDSINELTAISGEAAKLISFIVPRLQRNQREILRLALAETQRVLDATTVLLDLDFVPDVKVNHVIGQYKHLMGMFHELLPVSTTKH